MHSQPVIRLSGPMRGGVHDANDEYLRKSTVWEGAVDDAIRALAASTPAPNVVEIDLRAVMMEEIETAAALSPWVPPEYSMNEIVSDLCTFLLNDRAPPAPMVKVKPLVWSWPRTVAHTYLAKTSIGEYSITDLGSNWTTDRWVLRPDAGRLSHHSTADSAKAAAQADYEARILAALEGGE